MTVICNIQVSRTARSLNVSNYSRKIVMRYLTFMCFHGRVRTYDSPLGKDTHNRNAFGHPFQYNILHQQEPYKQELRKNEMNYSSGAPCRHN